MKRSGPVLYDPTAEPRTVAAALAPRLLSLAGKRAGILDNRTANAGTLMLAVVERPEERYGVTDVVKLATHPVRRVIARRDGTPVMKISDLRR